MASSFPYHGLPGPGDPAEVFADYFGAPCIEAWVAEDVVRRYRNGDQQVQVRFRDGMALTIETRPGLNQRRRDG